LARNQGQEVLSRDRILELAAQEALFNQDIEIRRKSARPCAPLEQADGPRVLLAAKDQLGFLFALRHLMPHRHGNREHDAHDAHRNQERDHRESGRDGATTRAPRRVISLTL
jgi:hypothetical protein